MGSSPNSVVTAIVAAKKTKESKAKKPAVAKKAKSSLSSHPPYINMITDAIVALKERTGSSQHAITKFIEENHKQLPSNFRKNLLVQLKKFVASGKLVKVKASYKLAVATKKPTEAKPKPNTKVTVKPKAKTIAAKPKATAKPAKVAKTVAKSTPGKKKVTAAVVAKPKKVAAKIVKKPKAKSVKSVKSPVKKVQPKKAKK